MKIAAVLVDFIDLVDLVIFLTKGNSLHFTMLYLLRDVLVIWVLGAPYCTVGYVVLV